MPRLSVIVPVYEVEEYLPQCLHSLLAQEGSWDLEIVCVNDGSPDLSPKILELFAQVDERIKIVDKENGGLSSARNAGIEAATGDYVAFVDSDDFVEPFYLETIEEALAPGDVDVLVFGARVWPERASYPWLEQVLSPRTCHYRGFCGALLNDKGTRPFAWRLVIRRELLQESGLRFDEDLVFGEDQAFMLELYPQARTISVISAKPYVYRVNRQGSLMAGRSEDLALKAHDHVRIVEHVLRSWAERGYVERWGREIFFWAIEFCAADILWLDNPDRSRILIYFSCVLRAFLPEASLRDWCNERGTLAAFANMVLFDRASSAGLARKLLFYRRTIANEGLAPFVRGPMGKIAQSAPAKAAASLVWQAAPELDPAERAAKDELRAEADRADGLLKALNALNARRAERGLEPFWDVEEEDVELTEDGLPVVEVPRQ